MSDNTMFLKYGNRQITVVWFSGECLPALGDFVTSFCEFDFM